MKKLIFILCSFLSINAFGQNNDSTSRDNKVVNIGHDLPTTKPHLKFLSVIDNKMYYGYSIKKVKPISILDVEVLKGKEASDIYGKLAEHGVVVITTKKYAVKTYQNKLDYLSKEYKNYLKKNKNNDSGLVYLINGVAMEGKQYDTIKKLFGVVDKIRTVDFVEKFSEKLNTNNPKPIIVITTQQ